MTVVRELVTKLSFNADTATLQRFNAGVNALKSNMKLAIGVAGALSAGLVVLIKRTTNYGDQLGETADKLGVGSEYLQAFGYAADLAGIKTEQFAGTLKIFAQRLALAQNGNKNFKEAFTELGISLTDVNGKTKSTEVLFTETLKTLSEMEDVQKRNALAYQVLGRSGTLTANLLQGKFGDLLANVKDFADKGNIIPRSEISKIEKLQDSFDKLGNTFEIFLTQVLAKFAPELESIITNIEMFIIENRKLIMSGLKDFFVDVFTFAKALGDFLKTLQGIFASFSSAVGGSEKALKYLFALFVAAKFGPWALGITAIGIGIHELWTQADDAESPLNKFIKSLDNTGDSAEETKDKLGGLLGFIRDIVIGLKNLDDWFSKKNLTTSFESTRYRKNLYLNLRDQMQNNPDFKPSEFARGVLANPSKYIASGQTANTYVNQSNVAPVININLTTPPTDAKSFATEAGLLIRDEVQKMLVHDLNEFPKFY